MKRILFFISLTLSIIFVFGQKNDEKKENVIKVKTCNFERNTDDSTGEITIKSPAIYNIQIAKFIDKTKTSYYLILKANLSGCFVDNSEVFVLFADSTKWNKIIEKIVSDIVEGDYEYTALVPINDNDLKLFSTKKILKYRLYLLDRKIKDGEAAEFVEYVKGIMKEI